MHALKALSIWASRVGETDVHPGRANLVKVRAELTGYEVHVTTIGRALQRAREAGLIERISHGGRFTSAKRFGRKADVHRFTKRGKRALYGKGDWFDAQEVSQVCPPRNVQRYAGVLARRAAAAGYQKECDAVKPGTKLGNAIRAAQLANRKRVVDGTIDDVVDGTIATELDVVAIMADFDASAPIAPVSVDPRFPVPALPAAAPPLQRPKPPPLPADASDSVRPEVRDIIARQLANKPPT